MADVGGGNLLKSMAKKIIILLIILLGAWWRFYQLGEIPSGVYVDETAVGYNAYSLAETGRDEYGQPWPVFMRLFGAFSSPLYTFVTAGVVGVIGLSDFSIRLISAVSGTLLVLLFYLILGELKYRWWLQMAGTLLLALAPWGVFLSRMALEGHLAMVLAVAAGYCFLKAEKNPRWWLGVGLCLALSSWSYQAARPIAWGLGTGVLWLGRKDWKSGWLRGGVGLFFISQIPQLLLLNQPAFTQRGVGLFYHNVPDKFREFWAQATAYLSPSNLFWRPDDDVQRSLPALSNFYPLLVAFYLPGWLMIADKWKKKEGKWWLLLLVTGLIVPALTKDPFSSVRGQFLLIPISLVIVWGMEWWGKRLNQAVVMGIFVGLLLMSQLWLWRSLIVLLPFERAAVWGYGFEQLAEEIRQRPDEHWLVEQSRQHPVYIQLLYHLRYPPEKYQQEIGDWSDNYYSDTNYDLGRNFGNIEVRNVDWKRDIYTEQILVGDELSISLKQASEHFLELMFEIEDPTGKLLFRGFRTNPAKKRISVKIARLGEDL